MLGRQPRYFTPPWFRWKRIEALLREALPDVDLDTVTLRQCADRGYLIVGRDAALGFVEAPDGETPTFTSEFPIRLLVHCFGMGVLSLLPETA